MARDPRYDILFEPIRIGPKTARNRFYQVPHCNGMGHLHPSGVAAMRGIKAEGGWAVVCTEECEIHPSGEVSPHPEARLWSEQDLPALARMAEAVQAQGALAGIELTHNGLAAPNRTSREVPLGPSSRPMQAYDMVQSRAIDKDDIRRFRQWHRRAALRARDAGFDIVYVYAGHDLTLQSHFLSRRYNDRIDEYGGSLENRVRLFRETLEDTKDAIGDRCAVVVRFAVDELMGEDGLTAAGEGREVVEMLAELPDLWDVNVADWFNDSQTSRFSEEGFQESFIDFVKQVTSKPVVGVGRFTSPDAMVSQIKRGVLDMIGAARPSIADPFLPKKIEEGRPEDIRECIGCNICVSGDYTHTPMRCTQNPTMSEEWRKGWHPERLPEKGSDSAVLVVGAGPAGLECAQALGKRGYGVTLAEAGSELGGRVTRESRLPGLAAWARVRDYRTGQLDQLSNVAVYRASRLTAQDVLGFGAEHVVLATGSHWRRDGIGRQHWQAIPGSDGPQVLTPDDLMAGTDKVAGPVVIFDDDHYYMGGVLAELLAGAGHEVTLVTPAADVSHWTNNTLEQGRIQTRLLERGVTLRPHRDLTAIHPDRVELACVFTGSSQTVPAANVVLVTARLPDDALYHDLMDMEPEARRDAGIASVTRIGDALAPATIAMAVYAGHRHARELDTEVGDEVVFSRELPALTSDWP